MRHTIIKFNVKFTIDAVKQLVGLFVDMEIQRPVFRLQDIEHVIVQLPDFKVLKQSVNTVYSIGKIYFLNHLYLMPPYMSSTMIVVPPFMLQYSTKVLSLMIAFTVNSDKRQLRHVDDGWRGFRLVQVFFGFFMVNRHIGVSFL